MLDCERTVSETVRLFPDTLPVFQAHGIDSCCGGALSVEEAARRHRIDRGVLCAELETVVRGAAASRG